MVDWHQDTHLTPMVGQVSKIFLLFYIYSSENDISLQKVITGLLYVGCIHLMKIVT